MKKKRRVGLATKVFVAIFSVYAAYTLISLQVQINDKREEQDTLQAELAVQQTRNAELEAVVGDTYDEAYIAQIARDSLDYIFPGEKVYVDISSK